MERPRRKVIPDFSIPLSFPPIPPISARWPGWGGFRGLGSRLRAVRFGVVPGHRGPMTPLRRLGFGLSPGGTFGSDIYHGRGAHPELGREECQSQGLVMLMRECFRVRTLGPSLPLGVTMRRPWEKALGKGPERSMASSQGCRSRGQHSPFPGCGLETARVFGAADPRRLAGV